MFTGNDKLIVSGSVTSVDIDGETVLLDVASAQYFGLNAVGGEIWKHIQSQETYAEILQHLCRTYGIEVEVAEKDLKGFLGKLLARKFVTIESCDTSPNSCLPGPMEA